MAATYTRLNLHTHVRLHLPKKLHPRFTPSCWGVWRVPHGLQTAASDFVANLDMALQFGFAWDMAEVALVGRAANTPGGEAAGPAHPWSSSAQLELGFEAFYC